MTRNENVNISPLKTSRPGFGYINFKNKKKMGTYFIEGHTSRKYAGRIENQKKNN